MNIEEKLRLACKKLGYDLIDLKLIPTRFQDFLDNVPDFFIERQGSDAKADEAKNIIENLPPDTFVKDKLLYGIQRNNKIIGFFEILLNFPNPSILVAENPQTQRLLGKLTAPRFTITFLLLHPDYRNQSLGKALLYMLEQILGDQGYQYSHLVVNESNIRAKQFYLRHGYQIIKKTFQFINEERKSCLILVKNIE